MYTPNQFLEKTVSSGDVFRVRGAITGIIQANPQNRGNEVENAIQYAEKNGIAVFVSDDDPTLEMVSDEGQWDSDYFASAVTYLQANFTRARLAHVLAVSKKTHPALPPVPPVSHRQPSQAKTPPTSAPVSQKKDKSHRKTALLAAAGIGLVALVVLLGILLSRK